MTEPTRPPELWGGLECTVARIGDEYRDEIVETGHRGRISDLDRLADLGIRTIRYPVVWETVAPGDLDEADWSWHDERLARIADLGITPIVGLVHHGSGPRHTSLLDPAFPEALAAYAEAVARRYPWIEHYTPVNEPLTTARFSALYGHWYPHERDVGAFLRATVIQCRAVALAMAAIRRVRPGAKLVQTEDLGKTFATRRLAYQAEYENDRRWLSLDLLCGQVTPAHPWYGYLLDHGITPADLAVFEDGAATPDIVGINHYLTSERYLDHRVERYPGHFRGSNGQEQYADVEAVRMDLPAGTTGPKARLREVWDRYGLPVAVTEAHHGCTREEQLRWLLEVWTAASELKAENCDIRAVTVWSMLGAFDWNSLLTRRTGFYEPGAFDVRSDPPRPTAIAAAAAALARGGSFEHPVLDRYGWWHREQRFYHPPARYEPRRGVERPRPLVIVGARAMLGQAFARICAVRGLDHVLVASGDVQAERAGALLQRHRPWAVILAGSAHEGLLEEEDDDDTGPAVPAALAAAAKARGLPVMALSSDLVFDGRLGRPLAEDDPVRPASPLGRRHAEAEAAVVAAHPEALVVRAGPLFGPWDRTSFASRLMEDLAAGRPVEVADALASPTYVPDLVHAALDLLIDGETGVWHLANQGFVSPRDLALRIAAGAGIEGADLRVVPSTRGDTSLTSRRGLVMPPLDSALGRFPHDRAAAEAERDDGEAVAAE